MDGIRDRGRRAHFELYLGRVGIHGMVTLQCTGDFAGGLRICLVLLPPQHQPSESA
ncbi:protein of unknown function [Aminobacter niigataensis]|nr:protein of unknown function [Aminobacter niigataensis]